MDLKWMADWGFDFVRIPMAYPSYVKFDRSRNITPDEVYEIDGNEVDKIEQLVDTAVDRVSRPRRLVCSAFSLHSSLGLRYLQCPSNYPCLSSKNLEKSSYRRISKNLR
jgi:hypothetical protein